MYLVPRALIEKGESATFSSPLNMYAFAYEIEWGKGVFRDAFVAHLYCIN